MERVRVDRWLWAVRLTRTRSGAAQVGDTVRARVGDRERVVEVVRLIETRVGAEPAAACLIDRSPPPPPRDPQAWPGRRDPGMGRPTKRERRQLDRARDRRS